MDKMTVTDLASWALKMNRIPPDSDWVRLLGAFSLIGRWFVVDVIASRVYRWWNIAKDVF
jgi:hypothetical protein